MKSISPQDIPVSELHSYLLGAVIPRPIAFASTIDREGNVNLSPFSFFNAFGANPPTLVFSPARRGRDNTTKHTLENVLEIPEVVINLGNMDLVEQMSLASADFPKGVNEFLKAGLTEVQSEMVKPPRVGEAPVAFECKVNDVIPLGNQGASGNLVICEVLLMHIQEDILDEKEKIDPYKFKAVARLGGNYYCYINPQSIFTLPKPIKIGIGFDQLPEKLRKSTILTGNNLARLAGVDMIPTQEYINQVKESEEVQELFKRFANDPESLEDHLHIMAQEELEEGHVEKAWAVLLSHR